MYSTRPNKMSETWARARRELAYIIQAPTHPLERYRVRAEGQGGNEDGDGINERNVIGNIRSKWPWVRSMHPLNRAIYQATISSSSSERRAGLSVGESRTLAR
ncbi:hypothetical protein GSI_09874 [Ganoderma sinense ZZ0214-1]|uniref:Uncharacterized protein n=1 Tax=Ganoderma sinense ZZ0214-1 TaxID=1077348 RepID=A0A2G8S2L3_9APHY|nr:hypothetical protein GSI_09874 [Ganoderma sinense ZZ0214-1]